MKVRLSGTTITPPGPAHALATILRRPRFIRPNARWHSSGFWILPLLFLLARPPRVAAQLDFVANNGAVTITGFNGSDSEVTIPETINGLPVTGIGNGAFEQNLTLKLVTIPNSVTNIGDHAFAATGLTTAIIPNSVTHIGNGAFAGCFGLAKITMGETVTTIGLGTFDSCRSLTNLTIPASVTSIEAYTFHACTNLASIVLPNGVNAINDYTFQDCTRLTDIAIGPKVTSIGNGAFSSCTTMTNITIPSGVTNIAASAFHSCSSLTAISVDASNPFYSSVDGVLFNRNESFLIECPEGKAGSYTLPTTVSSIGDYAFQSCGTMTSVRVAEGVISIGNGAFNECTSLSSISIPNSVVSMGDQTFYNCTSMTNVVIGEGIKSIGLKEFWGCTNLAGIRIPNSIVHIGPAAFGFCAGLTTVTVGNGVTSIADEAFESCERLTGIYFQGNAPSAGLSIFASGNNPTAYYLPGTAGWAHTFGGIPTALWVLPNPLILPTSLGFGMQRQGFGFIISWASNAPVVVEASASLNSPIWASLETNTLIGGSYNFSDPEWTNYPTRFYRVRSP